MKNKLKLIFLFLGITVFIFSFFVSVWSLLTGNYFNDYNNYKSLKRPLIYMETDTLLLEKIENYNNLNDNTPGKEIVYGILTSSKKYIKIVIGKQEYLNCISFKCPIYKSKLTKDYFLKDASTNYYQYQYRSFFITMILKIILFPMLFMILYIFWKERHKFN